MNDALERTLERFRRSGGSLLILTGAGVSAESGIPTFRGREGFWTVGSVNYTPMEMATLGMFAGAPQEVWAWYLTRFDACRAAAPNAAHYAIAALERHYGDRMTLVTQNIDGLHQRAGSTDARTLAIHGDARLMRCTDPSHDEPVPLPALGAARAPLPESTRRALTCPRCGGWMRPHVLWFDEYYDERFYRSESALKAAARAALLIVVGTTGSTTLPVQIGYICERRGIPIIDVNPEENTFGEMARAGGGVVLREAATEALPRIMRLLTLP